MRKSSSNEWEYRRIRGDSGHRRRIFGVMAILSVVAFIPTVLQLYRLMISEHDYYSSLAQKNQTRTTVVSGERGTLYDRNMNIVACSRSVVNIYLDPNELKQSGADLDLVSDFLAQTLELDVQWVRQKAEDTSYRYQRIAQALDDDTAGLVRRFINENKLYRFALEDRVRMLNMATEGLANVHVSYSLGRVVDYMKEHGIDRIVKGYRNDKDLEWERYQADYNFTNGGYETDLIKCTESFEAVSSTVVRDRLDSGEDISRLVPPAVEEYIKSLKRD
jgi:phosphopantetheine adenylyltransferase